MSPLGADWRSLPDRTERLLRGQHRTEGRYQSPGDRHPPHIVAVLLRDSIIERPKLRRTIDRMHRHFHQNPAQPRGALFGQPPQPCRVRRRMDRGHQARVGAQMPTVGKPMNVSDLAADQQGRVRPIPRNGAHELCLGIKNRDILNFLLSQVVAGGSGSHRRRGGPPRLGQAQK